MGVLVLVLENAIKPHSVLDKENGTTRGPFLIP